MLDAGNPSPPDVPASRVPLRVLTGGKLLVNIALRLAYPFLGNVSRGLGISLGEAGGILGAAELTGLASFFIGPSLDGGRHRRWFVTGMASTAVGCFVLALVHHPAGLFVGFCAITMGTAMVTTSGHSFLGTEVPYAERGRAIGLFETSWAFALLVGGPIAALLMRYVAWWSPWLVVGVLIICTVPLAAARMPDHAASIDRGGTSETSFAWAPVVTAVVASNLLTLAAVMVFATFGPWLEDVHGLESVGLGAVAVGLGAMELLGSGGSAVLADRVGKRRAHALGAGVMAGAVLWLVVLGARGRVFAIVGIVVMFCAFEFALVSILSVVSEVGGSRRATVVGVDHAMVTAMRAGGTALATHTYERSGIRVLFVASLVLALASATASMAGAAEERRHRHG